MMPKLNNRSLYWFMLYSGIEVSSWAGVNVFRRSHSLKELKEDVAKWKKQAGWKERPIYAC